ncbi:hypothetical protein [Actinobacillus lignieresii]|uniref:Uncharacterized protein n=1 Tax=Actinobacillus lignieresii TaxID=720 RepID=A0A380U5L6_ACTLI|nr:hypothetical protein [Actinobacillus lignieresii]SUT95889.1 Uncharacterised protein [Actinobacillus lignieresii]
MNNLETFRTIKQPLDMAKIFLEIALTGNGAVRRENGTLMSRDEILADAFQNLDEAHTYLQEVFEEVEYEQNPLL